MITHKLMRYCLLVISLLLLPKTSLYGEAKVTKPTPVMIGSYVQNIVDLNLRANSVIVDFYLWFRWQGDRISPHETFELANGKINSQTRLIDRVNGTEHFTQYRINATIYVLWDLERFTLDSQTIPIIIEDSKMHLHSLVYVPDQKNIAVLPSIKIPGYEITEQKGGISEVVYTSDFGE